MSALRPSTPATSGDDLIVVNGPDTVGGGLGDDVINVTDGLGLWDGPFNSDIHSLVNGNKGDDTIFGSSTTSDTLLGGQGDNSITDSFGADVLNGNLGNDVLVSGLPGDDVLIGDPVAPPILLGEGGSDTLIAHDSGVTFSGGEGADLLVFDFLPHVSSLNTGVILDWDTEDRLSVTRFGTGQDYLELTASDVAGATTAANAAILSGSEIVVVQVGDDLYAFVQSEPDNGADLMIRLVGRSLTDISSDNFT